MTVFAAVSPARKAAKVPPIAAMHAVATGSTGYGSKQRIFVGLGILGAGRRPLCPTACSATPATPSPSSASAPLLVFFGVSGLGRTISLPLSRVLGAPLPRLRGVAGELARENAMRNPKRTAASASALMIGVGLVGFITILAASTKTSLTRPSTGPSPATSSSTRAAASSGGVDPGLASQVGGSPEVESATGIRTGMARVDGNVETLAALDPATAFDIIDVQPEAGLARRPRPRRHRRPSRTSPTSEHLGMGDTVPVLFKDSGEQQLRVAMIYGENRPGRRLPPQHRPPTRPTSPTGSTPRSS